MSEINNVLVTGVGGQGILLATDVLADVFLKAGFDAKKSEVHGMAQRGGSVESHVRRSARRVDSPLIPEGCVDVLLAFEPLEALRYVHLTHPRAWVIYDPRPIPPLSVSLGQSAYPTQIEQSLKRFTNQILPVSASDIANALGNPRVSNVALLGALQRLMGIDEEIWLAVIRERVPAKAIEVNLAAFKQGQKA